MLSLINEIAKLYAQEKKCKVLDKSIDANYISIVQLVESVLAGMNEEEAYIIYYKYICPSQENKIGELGLADSTYKRTRQRAIENFANCFKY